MTNLQNANEQLQTAWSNLKQQWQVSALLWNDEVRYRFEKDYMEAYEGIVVSVLKQIEMLQQVISQASHNVP